MKKITKKERKRISRNAFVEAIKSKGKTVTINNEVYIDGGYGTGSKGQSVKLPTVRQSY